MLDEGVYTILQNIMERLLADIAVELQQGCCKVPFYNCPYLLNWVQWRRGWGQISDGEAKLFLYEGNKLLIVVAGVVVHDKYYIPSECPLLLQVLEKC